MTAQAWTFRVVWPLEDPELSDANAIDLARATARSWPATNTAVVCVVPAVPAARRLVA